MTVVACDADLVRRESLEEAGQHLAELADAVERDGEGIRLTRDGHGDLVLVSADEFESLVETVVWQQDEAARAAVGEAPGDGEPGPGLDDAAVREKYRQLLGTRHTG